jgi:two-component system, OmpR family, alkaline phosphatase synthesis response regulator PhoP
MSDTKNKILIVEDEASLRDALGDKLELEGFNVIKAKNGQEGLEVALREHPDLILLDIIMPVMGGLIVLKNLRQDVWGKKVKVIMLTNLSDTEKTAEAVEQESFDFLVKSDWKMEGVLTKIKERLKE